MGFLRILCTTIIQSDTNLKLFLINSTITDEQKAVEWLGNLIAFIAFICISKSGRMRLNTGRQRAIPEGTCSYLASFELNLTCKWMQWMQLSYIITPLICKIFLEFYKKVFLHLMHVPTFFYKLLKFRVLMSILLFKNYTKFKNK